MPKNAPALCARQPHNGQRVNPVLPDIRCEEDDGQPPPPAQTLPPHHSARVVWEVLTGAAPDAWTRLEPVAAVDRPETGQVMDDTRSLTLDGIVEVWLPATRVTRAAWSSRDTTLLYPLSAGIRRLRRPPHPHHVIPNGVVAEQAVPVFQTFTIAADVTPHGAAPTPGTMTRLQMQVNDSGVITALTFFDPAAAPNHPDLYVLSYVAPGWHGPRTDSHWNSCWWAGAMGGRTSASSCPRRRCKLKASDSTPIQVDVWQEWTRTR